MGAGRGIDHVGIASRDLDRLAARYEALGFTLTPRAYHRDHMGTSNRLVQFEGRNFIELLEVDRPGTMLAHSPGFMGFGAFNHDFLKHREGLSLIVFRTEDTAADLAAWRANGLDVYDQFDFQRQAVMPDGSEATVRFELGFVTSPLMPEILFYVCHNRAEAHFWKPDYQQHANGAEELVAVILCAEEPERHGPFLSALFGGAVYRHGGGIRVACGDHHIAVMPPDELADCDWKHDAGIEAVAAGLRIRCPARSGTVTPPDIAGGAFVHWT